METIEGRYSKSKTYLGADNYLYKINKSMGSVEYLRCCSKNCRATGKLIGGKTFQAGWLKHNHEPSRAEVDKLKYKECLRTLSRETNRTFLDIYEEAATKHELGAKNSGRLHSVWDTMARARKESTPAIPRTLRELDKAMADTG